MIKINLEKAKEIHKEKVREARKPLLDELDTDFVRALEEGTDTSNIIAKKKKLRDATKISSRIKTVEKLKDSWDESLLGPSPYPQELENSQEDLTETP